MAREFFAGAEAGMVGLTENGYPIRNYQLVAVYEEEALKAVFQLREMHGVIEDGVFREAKPEFKSVSYCSSIEPEYDFSYSLNGEKIAEEELLVKYEVVEVTAVLKAIQAFKEKTDTETPYFSSKCIDFLSGAARLLDEQKNKDKAIIDAVMAVMNG